MPDTYDITPDGFYLGAANVRRGYPGPVTVPPPASIPIRRARWDGAQWVDDPAQEQADAAAAQAAEAERTGRAQAVAFLRGLDFDSATAAQTRQAVKALWTLLKVMHRE